jgi:hypothetical protein
LRSHRDRKEPPGQSYELDDLKRRTERS